MLLSPYYTYKNVPEYIVTRTDKKYDYMSLSDLQKMGFWNKRLDKIIPFMPDNAYIAGGFLRAMIAGENDANGDIDFFFSTSQAFADMFNIMNEPREQMRKGFGWYSMVKYDVPLEQLRAINYVSDIPYRPDIQLVRLWYYDSPKHVIDNFDMTVCQFAIDKERIYYNPQAFDDIKTKTIRFHRKTGNALSTLNRILKYKEKGYSIDPELFNEIEKEAISLLDKTDEINEYFYADKDISKEHGRAASFLHRTWQYLEYAPQSAAAYRKMMNKRKRPKPKTTYTPIYLGSS